jgi:alpha-L-fucosidase 2
MLLKSSTDTIRLLPALPPLWQNGSIKGLRCCGGFEADIFWNDGKLVKARIISLLGNDCSLSYKQKRINFKTQKNSEYLINDKLELI